MTDLKFKNQKIHNFIHYAFCILISLVVISSYLYYRYVSLEASLSPIVLLSGGVWNKAFLNSPQKLHQERLNLNVWGGFHELKLGRVFHEKQMTAKFDFFLSPKSYIYIYLNYSDEEHASGIRLSSNIDFPSISLVRNGAGEFLEKQPLNLELIPGLHKLSLEYNFPSVTVSLDEKIILKGDYILKPGVTLAWGGSEEKTPVWIDNLVVANAFGGVLLEKKFSRFEGTLSAQELFFIVLSLIIYFVATFFINNLGFRTSVHFSAFLMLLSAYLFYFFVTSSNYFAQPGLKKEDIEARYGKLTESYKSQLGSAKLKVFFYGGSKTFGDGARKKSDVWVNVLKENLKMAWPASENTEFFNWGVPSAKTEDIIKMHAKLQLYKPSLVVLFVGVNEDNVELFVKNVRELIKMNDAIGAKTVILEEGVYVNEVDKVQYSFAYMNFSTIKTFCNEKNVFCIETRNDLYDPKTRLYDSGLLFVEWVHSTSYGQKVFADLITTKFMKILKGVE